MSWMIGGVRGGATDKRICGTYGIACFGVYGMATGVTGIGICFGVYGIDTGVTGIGMATGVCGIDTGTIGICIGLANGVTSIGVVGAANGVTGIVVFGGVCGIFSSSGVIGPCYFMAKALRVEGLSHLQTLQVKRLSAFKGL